MAKKVLYIDGSALVRNSQGGIAHYTAALIDQLSRSSDFDARVLLFRGDNITISAPIEYLPVSRKIYMGLWRLFPRLSVDRWLKNRPDAVIYPNFSMTPYVSNPSTTTITVVHDLTYIHYPHTVEQKNRLFLKLAVKRSCKSSSYIVTPSQASQSDLSEHYSIKGGSAVAYPGYDPLRIDGTLRSTITSLVESPYILFIGTIEPRKNIEALCEAYLQSDFYHNNCRLIVAGAQGWGKVTIPDNPSIITLGKISNKERELLLRRAAAFTFPSLFEGFGMPVIEAMRSGIPVLTSDTSSLREIASTNNSYIVKEPFDSANILTPLNELYADMKNQSPEYIKRVEQARLDSDQYTWERCAEVFAAIILNSTK